MGYLGNVRPTIALVAADIADGAVTAAKLGTNAVTSDKINADAVTAAKIATDAVGSSELNLAANYAFTGTITGAGGGITGADQWRATTGSMTGNGVFTPWERPDEGDYDKIGTGMTVSSGVFTFPETGIWMCGFFASSAYGSTADNHEVYFQVTSDNGSNWRNGSYGRNGCVSGVHNAASAIQLLDVTNTSNIQIRLFRGSMSSGSFTGSSTYSITSVYFIRLGDT